MAVEGIQLPSTFCDPFVSSSSFADLFLEIRQGRLETVRPLRSQVKILAARGVHFPETGLYSGDADDEDGQGKETAEERDSVGPATMPV